MTFYKADLTKAGNHSKQEGDYHDYRKQGQQNDYFAVYLSLAGNEAKENGEESCAS